MKYFKLFLILFALLLLSGCTVNEKVTMDYDGKVSQTVTFPVKVQKLTKKDFIKYAKNVIDIYRPALDARGYEHASVYGKKNSKVVFNNSFDNICEYFGKTVFSQYVYKIVKCAEDNGYYVIKNETEYIPYCADCLDWPSLDSVRFSIVLPIKPEEHNADKVDGKTYTWIYDKDTRDKDFYIKISIDELEKYKANYEEYLKKQQLIKRLKVVAVILIFAAGIAIFALYMYKQYKKNKIEY